MQAQVRRARCAAGRCFPVGAPQPRACQEGQKVPVSELPLGVWAAWAELPNRALKLLGIQRGLWEM